MRMIKMKIVQPVAERRVEQHDCQEEMAKQLRHGDEARDRFEWVRQRQRKWKS